MKPHWIKRTTFQELFDVSCSMLNAAVHNGAVPKKHITRNYINESYFVTKLEKIRRMKMANQDLYYLISQHFTNRELVEVVFGKQISSAEVYISNDLFMYDDRSIIDLRFPKNGVKLYRYWWKIERRLRRKGASISKILDNRMYNDIS